MSLTRLPAVRMAGMKGSHSESKHLSLNSAKIRYIDSSYRCQGEVLDFTEILGASCLNCEYPPEEAEHSHHCGEEGQRSEDLQQWWERKIAFLCLWYICPEVQPLSL